MQEIEIDLPVMVGFDIDQREPARLPTLAGARVAVLDNGWTSMDEMYTEFARRLGELGVVDVRRWMTPSSRPLEQDVLDEIAANADAAIVGLGN